MVNQVPNLANSPPPYRHLPSLPRDYLDELNRCARALERRGARTEIPEAFAPSSVLRAVLTRHAEALRLALQPAGIEETMRILVWIFRCFPDFSGGGEGALFDVEVYSTSLSQYPLWALKSVRSKAENSRADFRLSLPKLKGWAEDATRIFEKELRDVDDVLGARVASPPRVFRDKSFSARWRSMAAEIERVGSARPNRGDLVAPAMVDRLAGDRSVSLGDFLAGARERSFAPAHAKAAAEDGDAR